MLKHKKSYLIAFIICLLLIFTAVPAFAAGGDGTGGGNGENRDIALTLESSSVKDGDTDVSCRSIFQLNFNKNICNVTVLANNKMCFHLSKMDGTPVPIKLTFPDNQVQKKYRREVFIEPVEPLEPHTNYRISVDSTLAAKNGTVADDAHTIVFTTGTSNVVSPNKVLEELDDYVITYETAEGENENSVPVNKNGLDDVSEDNGPDTGSIARIAAIALIIVIIVFTAVFIIFKRRK